MNAVQNAPDGQHGPPDTAGGDDTEELPTLVLLVEDNELDRDMYGGLLWYNGFSVLYAGDGETAIQAALTNEPDLILLDINLPGELSGLDVAVQLHARGFSAPMIVLSALPRAEIAGEVEKAGLTTYLEKPISPFAVVREVLRKLGSPRRRSR